MLILLLHKIVCTKKNNYLNQQTKLKQFAFIWHAQYFSYTN
jgi:hypothetical protein